MNEINYKSDILELIRYRLGIHIHNHQIKDLNQMIENACQKFDITPLEYYQKIKTCSDNSPLLEHLITNITVGETYFFRDNHQMKLLQDKILPEIIQKKRKESNLTLRIWSAGCATGEELYTLGMMLLEILPDIKNWSLHLLGTDLNTAALKKAIKGCYTEWSMRSITDKFKQNYFLKKDNKYILLLPLREMTEFIYLNLNDNTYPSLLNGTNAQDLILCRNVLIYVDSECAAKMIKKLSSSLIEGGYLLLGASDPINIKGAHLSPYQGESLLFFRSTVHQKILPPSFHPKKEVEKSIIAILRNENFITPRTLPEKKVDVPKKTPATLTAQATELANKGHLDLAVKLCKESLLLDKANKDTYFTLAMILVELNQLKEAESALRNVLYLDHHFVIGHFQLGLLLLRNKQPEMGLKSLKNALTLAAAENPSQPVSGYQGLNYGRLSEILKQEIELHKVNNN